MLQLRELKVAYEKLKGLVKVVMPVTLISVEEKLAKNQDCLTRALDFNMTSDEYHELINFARDACGRRGTDKALRGNDVDILVGPGYRLLLPISGTAGQSPQLYETFIHYPLLLFSMLRRNVAFGLSEL